MAQLFVRAAGPIAATGAAYAMSTSEVECSADRFADGWVKVGGSEATSIDTRAVELPIKRLKDESMPYGDNGAEESDESGSAYNNTLRENFQGALRSASQLVEGLIERKIYSPNVQSTESNGVDDKEAEGQVVVKGGGGTMSPFSTAVFTRLGDHLFQKSIDKEMLRDCVAAAKEVVESDAVMDQIQLMGISRGFSFSGMRSISSSASSPTSSVGIGTSTSTSRSYAEDLQGSCSSSAPASDAELKEEIERLTQENVKLRARYEALAKQDDDKKELKLEGNVYCSKGGQEADRPGSARSEEEQAEEEEDMSMRWVDIVKAIVGVICAVAFVIARRR